MIYLYVPNIFKVIYTLSIYIYFYYYNHLMNKVCIYIFFCVYTPPEVCLQSLTCSRDSFSPHLAPDPAQGLLNLQVGHEPPGVESGWMTEVDPIRSCKNRAVFCF